MADEPVTTGTIENDPVQEPVDETVIADSTEQEAAARYSDIEYTAVETPTDRLEFLAQQHDMTIVDLRKARYDPAVVQKMPQRMCERHKSVCLSEDGDSVTVAIADPTDLQGVDLVQLYFSSRGQSVNWVLAKENTAEAIKEALKERRTMVYWGDHVFGALEYLNSLFNGCVALDAPVINRKNGQHVQLSNRSDLSFDLVLKTTTEGISAPQNIKIRPGKTVRLNIGFDKEKEFDLITLNYTVANLKPTPDKGLDISFLIKVE